MASTNKIKITVVASVKAPLEKVWELWTTPEDIIQWNNASDDWHTPSAVNQLIPGGTFVYRMEARDGSFGFDFGGVYDEIKQCEVIAYTLGDGRKVKATFHRNNNDLETEVKEVFEAETENTIELQQRGWQAILNNFKRYAESKSWPD